MEGADFAASFDLYIHWPLRLKRELPFLTDLLGRHGARTVLDAGAGTGRHAAALAGAGFAVEACDLHDVVLEKARAHVREEGRDVRLFTAAFTEIPEKAGRTYAAVLCLGNSLCMVADEPAFYASVAAMAAVLEPGGVLAAHAVNYPALRASSIRFGPPRALADGRLVLKLFDTQPGRMAVNIVVLAPGEDNRWSLTHTSHPLLDVTLETFEQAFWEAGLAVVETFGSAKGEPYDEEASKDLFVVGRKK